MARGKVKLSSLANDATLDVVTATDVPPWSARLDELAQNPVNPRESYDDIDELAESLSESGQLQPVTVVARNVFLAHYPEHEEALGNARWVVIMGNRRLAAARRAGLSTLLISVQDHLAAKDGSRIPESTLIENIHRQALPPLLEARELQALVEVHGSQAKLAKRISKSQGWISQRIGLLSLHPDLQEELRKGELSVEEARSIARRPRDEQKGALDLLRRNNGAAEEEVAAEEGGSTSKRGRSGSRGRKGAPTRQRVPIRIDAIENTAADLKAALTTEQLAALRALLDDE